MSKLTKLLAQIPEVAKGVLVVSESGWWEAHGNILVASVKHKPGDDDEALNAKLPYGFKGLISKKSLRRTGRVQMETSRTVTNGRLDRLVEKFGPVIDRHPLLWLADVAEAMGVDEWTALNQLTKE